MLKKIATLLTAVFLTLGSSVFCFAEEFKPVLVVSKSGYTQTWKSIDAIGEQMGFGAVMKAFEATRESAVDVEGFNKERPLGFALLTNSKEFFPFGFIPVGKLDQFELLHNVLGEKLSKENGRQFYEYESGKKVELKEKEGWLYIFEPGRAELLPAGDPSRFLSGLDKEYFLAVKLFPENISANILDLAFAPVRQQLAQTDNKEQVKQAEAVLKYAQKEIGSLDAWIFGLKVDQQTRDIVFESAEKFVSGSELAKVIGNMSECKVKTNPFFNSDSAVISGCFNFILPESGKKTFEEYYVSMFENIRGEIANVVESKEDQKQVNVIIDNFKKLALDALTQEQYSKSIILLPDPVLAISATISDEKLFEKSLSLIVDYFKKENAEAIKKYVRLNAGKIKDCSYSTLDIPLSELNIEYPKGGTLSVLVGTEKGRFVVLAGIDSKKVLSSFRQYVEKGWTGESAALSSGKLSIKNLGTLLNLVNNEDIEFTKFRALLQKADSGAVINMKQEIKSNQLVAKTTVTSKCISLIGDIARISLASSIGGGKGQNNQKSNPKELESGDELFK